MSAEEIREERHPASGKVAEEARPGNHPACRDRRGVEPILVEIAWLVIEGSRVLWRLRRILARI